MKRTILLVTIFVLGVAGCKEPAPKPTPPDEPTPPEVTTVVTTSPKCKEVRGWKLTRKSVATSTRESKILGADEVSFITPVMETKETNSNGDILYSWSHVDGKPCPEGGQFECLKKSGTWDRVQNSWNEPETAVVEIDPGLPVLLDQLGGELRICSYTITPLMRLNGNVGSPKTTGGGCEISNGKPVCQGN